MSSEELRYLADTGLIDRVLKMDMALSKEASISDSLGSISTAVQKYVIDKIDTSSGEGLIKSVLRLLEPSVFFYIHPVLGILSTVGQMFGFSVTDMLSSLVDTFKPKIERGERVSPEEINAAGRALMGGEGEVVSASYDFFGPLRKLAQEGLLFKAAFSPIQDAKRFYNQPMLYRVFGFLGKGKSRGLIVGFLVWFLKTVLLSAGLLAVGGTINELLKNKSQNSGGSSEQNSLPFTPSTNNPQETVMEGRPQQQTPASLGRPVAPPVGLTPSGRGEQLFKNDDRSAWIVPLYGNVPNTLILWTTEIYPELKGHENLIEDSSSFNRVANILEDNMDYRTPNYLIMPPGFNRRIDVVNLFAGDVAKKLKEGRNEQNI